MISACQSRPEHISTLLESLTDLSAHVEEPGEERESISMEEIEENTYVPERVIHAL